MSVTYLIVPGIVMIPAWQNLFLTLSILLTCLLKENRKRKEKVCDLQKRVRVIIRLERTARKVTARGETSEVRVKPLRSFSSAIVI